MWIRKHKTCLLTTVGQPVLQVTRPMFSARIGHSNVWWKLFSIFILQVPREPAALRVLPPPHHPLGQGRRQEDQVCSPPLLVCLPTPLLIAFSSSLSLICTHFLSACLHPLLIAFSFSLSLIYTPFFSSCLHPHPYCHLFLLILNLNSFLVCMPAPPTHCLLFLLILNLHSLLVCWPAPPPHCLVLFFSSSLFFPGVNSCDSRSFSVKQLLPFFFVFYFFLFFFVVYYPSYFYLSLIYVPGS